MEGTKTLLENRLTKYSLTAGAVLAGALNTNATVIESSPNQTVYRNSYTINFSGSEFTIKHSGANNPGHWTSTFNGTTTTSVWIPGNIYGRLNIKANTNNAKWVGANVSALSTTQTISAGKTFERNNGNSYQFASSNNNVWVKGADFGNTTKYIGVQFNIGANTHYGWIEIRCASSLHSGTEILRYAYEDQVGVPIKSGSTVSLPVELTTFTALQYQNAVKLLWATATEVNNYGFEIQRIANSEFADWENVGFVAGNGNSNSPKSYEFIDENAPVGELEYRLKQIDTDGKFEYYALTTKVNNTITDIEENNLPLEFALNQNFPNPFNPTTSIQYSIPVVAPGSVEGPHITLTVYDLLGKEVATLVNKEQAAGNYSIDFDASNLPSGMYIYKITAGNFVASRKMMLLK